MTHEEISARTKTAFADALKKLMAQKPLDKITVKELVEYCNVNRKTFYYHFSDINDLLKWILEEEAVEVVKQFDLHSNFPDVTNFIVDYVESNAHILNCAYNSLGRDEMKRFLSKDFFSIVESIVIGYEEQLGIHLAADFRQLICTFYVEGTAGLIIDWFQNTKRLDRATVVADLNRIVESAIPAVIAAGRTEPFI